MRGSDRTRRERKKEGKEEKKPTMGHDAITSSPSSPPSSRLPLVSVVTGLGWEDEECERGMYRQIKGKKEEGRQGWKMK